MNSTRLLSIFILPAIMILPDHIVLAQSDTTTLRPRQGNAQYGLIDRQGNRITGFLYNDMGPFLNGLARVNKGGTTNPEGLVTGGDWGYINKKGEEVIPLVYDRAWHFGEGKAPVLQHVAQSELPGKGLNNEPLIKTEIIRGKDVPIRQALGHSTETFWNFIDTLGDFAYDKAYKNASRIAGSQALQPPLPVSVFQNRYDYVWHLRDGLAKVNIGGKMDSLGHVSGGKFGFVDANGKEVVPLEYDYLWYAEDSVIIVAKHTDMNKDKFAYGLLDMQGMKLAPVEYDSIPRISDGKVILKQRSKYTCYDIKAQETKEIQSGWYGVQITEAGVIDTFVDANLAEMCAFYEGFAAARFTLKYSDNWESRPVHYEAIEPGEDMPEPPSDTAPTDSYVTPIPEERRKPLEEGWFFLNAGGAPDSTMYFAARDFHEGMAAVIPIPAGPGRYHPDSMKWGFVDNQLRQVIAPAFDEVKDFQTGLARVVSNKKWGLIDKTGKFLLEPSFDTIGLFHEGFAPIQLEGDWGFVNAAGQVVVQPKFPSVGRFSDGLAYAKEGLVYGYIDTTGRFAIRPQFEVAYDFQGKVATVAINRRWGFVNSADSFIIEDIYYKAHPFCEGLAAVANRKYLWNFIDAQGKEIMPLSSYSEVRDFNREVAFVKQYGKWGLIDKQGRELIKPKYDHVTDFEKGVAMVCVGCSYEKGEYKNGKWGYINEHGQEITLLKYTEVRGFYDGVARVKVDGLIGLIDSSGREIIEPVCFRIDDLEDGLFKVYVGVGMPTKQRYSDELIYQKALIGYIDITGSEIIPIQYEYILESEKDILLIYANKEYGFLRKTTGEVIVPLVINSMRSVYKTLGSFALTWDANTSLVTRETSDGQRFGLVNRRGKLVIPIEYAYIWDFGVNDLARVNKGGKIVRDTSKNIDNSLNYLQSDRPTAVAYATPSSAPVKKSSPIYSTRIEGGKTGYIDRAGTTIIPLVYDDVWPLQQEKLFKVKQDGLYGLLSLDGNQIAPVVYQKIYDFNNKRAIFRKNSKYGVINTLGREIIPALYDTLFYSKEATVAAPIYSASKVTLKKPTSILSAEQSNVFFKVVKNEMSGLLDTAGHEVLKPEYDRIGNAANEWIEIQKQDKVGFFNINRRQLIPPQYEEVGQFSKGYARVKSNGLWGFINESGKMVLPAVYEDAIDFERWFIVKKGGKWGIINQKGKKITDFIYQKILPPQGNAVLAVRDGKYRILNRKGKEKIKEDFKQAFYTAENYIKIGDGKKWGLVDSSGKKITAIEYDVIWNYMGNYARVTKDGKWGFIDKKGKVVVPVVYDDVKGAPEGNLLAVMKDSLWGIYYDKARKKTDLIYNFIEIDYIYKMIEVGINVPSTDSSEKKMKRGFWTFSEKYIEPLHDFIFYRTSQNALKIMKGVEMPYIVVGNDKCYIENSHILAGDSCKAGIINWKGEILLPVEYQFESAFENQPSFIIVKKNKKYGVVDSKFKIIIPTDFDHISFFDHGLFYVQRERLRGIMDSMGRVVIPVKYNSVSNYDQKRGLFKVSEENLVGVVNSRNEVVIPVKYSLVSSGTGILQTVMCEDGYWGYIDSASGKEVIPCQFSLIKKVSFNEQAFVKKDGKWIVIDKKGNKLINEADGFDELGRFYQNGERIEVRRKDKWGVCDKNGKVIIPVIYDYIFDYKDGYAVVNNNGIYQQDNRYNVKGGVWGIADSLGNEIVPLSKEYDAAQNFNDDYAPVKKNGKWGWVNKKGALVIPLKYDEFFGYQEGLAVVKANVRFGFVDEKGEIAIPLRYSEARGFSEGFAAVEDEFYRWGFIDKKGKNIVSPKYDYVEDFQSGLAKVNRLGRKVEIELSGLNVIESGRSGYIDTSGNEIAPLDYTFATSFHSGYAIAGKDGIYERLRYDAVTKKITSEPFNYDRVEFFSKSHVIVVKNGLYGLVEIASGREALNPVYDEINLYREYAIVSVNAIRRDFYINDKGICIRYCENKK